ncbi:Uncharacterised protein [Escherichia coli]|uniref:Uncharacterized protein n=1 Tax=Escherichia coli TaxID=562 RepID=A0A376KTD7_ECOLX|nr:Uncharacterised protein [Escherichia coli]
MFTLLREAGFFKFATRAGLGIEKGLTGCPFASVSIAGRIIPRPLFRLVFSGSFFDQLLQFANADTFRSRYHNRRPARRQPTVGGKVGQLAYFGSSARMSGFCRNINIGKTFATCGKRLDCLGRETAQLGSFGEPFMYSRIGFSAIWRWIFSIVVAHCLASSNFFTAVI